MLEFMKWEGVVSGSEIWSETRVFGSLNINDVSTDAWGHVSGGGGSGSVGSTVHNMRRVYVDVGNGKSLHFVTLAEFAVREGDSIVLYGARRSGDNGNFAFFHARNQNSDQYTRLCEPARFAVSKTYPLAAVIFGGLAIAVAVAAAFILALAGIHTVWAIVIALLLAARIYSIVKTREKHAAEVAALQREMVNYLERGLTPEDVPVELDLAQDASPGTGDRRAATGGERTSGGFVLPRLARYVLAYFAVIGLFFLRIYGERYWGFNPIVVTTTRALGSVSVLLVFGAPLVALVFLWRSRSRK